MFWQANKMKNTGNIQNQIFYKKRKLKLEAAEENQDFFKTILEEAEKGNISHCAEIIDIDTEGKKNPL